MPQIRTLEGKSVGGSMAKLQAYLKQSLAYPSACCMLLICMYAYGRNILSIYVPAVQVATWVKRNFALKPALSRIRKQRAEHRELESDQVDRMY